MMFPTIGENLREGVSGLRDRVNAAKESAGKFFTPGWPDKSLYQLYKEYRAGQGAQAATPEQAAPPAPSPALTPAQEEQPVPPTVAPPVVPQPTAAKRPAGGLGARAARAAGGGGESGPIMTIRGNTVGFWDPKTQREFPTLKEAKAGVSAQESWAASGRAHNMAKAQLRARTELSKASILAAAQAEQTPWTAGETSSIEGPGVYGFNKATGTFRFPNETTGGQPGGVPEAPKWHEGKNIETMANIIAAAENETKRAEMFSQLDVAQRQKVRKRLEQLFAE
jgi:hypothetical protein